MRDLEARVHIASSGAAHELPDVPVWLTVVGGRVVHVGAEAAVA